MLNPLKRTFIFIFLIVKQKLLVNLFTQEEIYHLQMIVFKKFYHKELIVIQIFKYSFFKITFPIHS